jgi:hypothetical protein
MGRRAKGAGSSRNIDVPDTITRQEGSGGEVSGCSLRNDQRYDLDLSTACNGPGWLPVPRMAWEPALACAHLASGRVGSPGNAGRPWFPAGADRALLIGMALGAFQGSTWANRAHRYLPMLRVSVLVERSLFHRLLLPSPRRDRPRGKGASVKRAALGLCAVLIAVVQSGMLVGRGVALLVQLMAARRRSPRNLDRLSASIPAISVTACRGVVRNCRGSKRRRIERSQSMSRCLHGACSQAVMLG